MDDINRSFQNVMISIQMCVTSCSDCKKILRIDKGQAYICMKCYDYVMCEVCYIPVKPYDWPKLPRQCKYCSEKYILN